MATQSTAPATPSHDTKNVSKTDERSTELAFYAFVGLLVLALLAVAWTFMNL